MVGRQHSRAHEQHIESQVGGQHVAVMSSQAQFCSRLGSSSVDFGSPRHAGRFGALQDQSMLISASSPRSTYAENRHICTPTDRQAGIRNHLTIQVDGSVIVVAVNNLGSKHNHPALNTITEDLAKAGAAAIFGANQELVAILTSEPDETESRRQRDNAAPWPISALCATKPNAVKPDCPASISTQVFAETRPNGAPNCPKHRSHSAPKNSPKRATHRHSSSNRIHVRPKTRSHSAPPTPKG